MEYRNLTEDQQKQMLDNRITQLEAEHYGNVLNRDALAVATDIPDEQKQAQIDQIDTNIATIEAAHSVALDQLDQLDSSGSATTSGNRASRRASSKKK